MTAPTSVPACYRHPDRPGGIRCQRCERPICPQCMSTASVGFHCPECAKGGAQKVYRGIPSLRQRPIVMQVLIGLNVLVYLATAGTSRTQPWTDGGQALARFGWRGVEADGVLFGPLVPDEPWRLVTSGFLHDGIFHLGINMWSLYILATVLEPVLGRLRFGVLYGACLLTGSLGVALLSPEDPTLGASGAIYGLLGALVVVARKRNIDLVRSGLLPILGLNLLFTFLIPGISIGGHLGGLAGGVLFGVVLTEGSRLWSAARDATISTAVMAAGGLVAAVVAYVVLAGQY